MCEHCGCRGVEPIAELMDEHFALLDLGGDLRRALAAEDRPTVVATLAELTDRLGRHVGREERGIFTALTQQGDFADAVRGLEAEHAAFDTSLARLDPERAGFAEDLLALLEDLVEHIDKENLGLFPAAVVTLGARGWETIGDVHEREPSFLVDPVIA